MRAVRMRGESAVARLRHAVARRDLPPVGCGLGYFLRDDIALRAASSLSIAFFGERRASEVAAPSSQVCADSSTGTVGIEVRRQKDAQFGGGQLAHIAARPLSGGACPVHLLWEWLWLRKWLAVRRDRARRLSGAEVSAPLFVGLARARFGRSMPAPGMSARNLPLGVGARRF